MINCHEISEFVPAFFTENGNQLCRAVLHGRQTYWCKTGRKMNTHIGDAALENEQAAYDIAGRIRIPYLPDAESMDFDGQRWLVTTQAPGNRLLDIHHSLSPEDQAVIEEEIFRFISMLRRGRAIRFGSLTKIGPHFESERALMEHMLQIRGGASDDQVKGLFSILDQLEAQNAFETQPVLVHYDLWPGNIFYNAESRTVTVIDLERCFYSDSCAEGASLLGMMDAAVLERRLCGDHPARIVKMYVYRVLFLLERLDCCSTNEEYRDIRHQLDTAMDTLSEKNVFGRSSNGRKSCSF